MKSNKINLLLLAIISVIIVVYVIGPKLFHLNDYSLSNNYDVIKNYFTLVYYTDIDTANILSFSGMSYPYQEHILYTDNTPLLGIILRLFGIKGYSVGAFNFLVIGNIIIAPLVAFFIGEELGFKPVINTIFSLTITWLTPQLFNLYSSANLSLSSIILLGFLLLVKIYKYPKVNYIIYVPILIILSSFIHMYYLILLSYVFLLGFTPLLFTKLKLSLKYILWTLTGVICVFLIIRFTDVNYELRPKGGLGFNYHLWRSDLINFFTSYEFLSFPSLLEHSNYHPDWFAFLGSAIPLSLSLSLYVTIKNKLICRKNLLYKSLLFVSVISAFTALGNDINIFSLEIFNFLNPLYLLSFITEKVNNFRFLSRFNFIAFIGFNILIFSVLNYALLKYSKKIKYVIWLILAIYLYDISEMINYHKEFILTSKNIFSKSELDSIPIFDKTDYKAILPLPYYNIGSETNGYIIDDNNSWSPFTYQLSYNNKIPLLASKLSRTPPSIVKPYFSLFDKGKADPSLIAKLKDKSILIARSKKHKSVIMKDEPAKFISNDINLFIDIYKPILIGEDNEVAYYKHTFQ